MKICWFSFEEKIGLQKTYRNITANSKQREERLSGDRGWKKHSQAFLLQRQQTTWRGGGVGGGISTNKLGSYSVTCREVLLTSAALFFLDSSSDNRVLERWCLIDTNHKGS